jgi:hypothetical protein
MWAALGTCATWAVGGVALAVQPATAAVKANVRPTAATRVWFTGALSEGHGAGTREVRGHEDTP